MNTLIAPIVGVVAGILSAWAMKAGLELSQETASGVVLFVFAVVTKLIARFTNPADVADPVLAEQGKQQARAMRASAAVKR